MLNKFFEIQPDIWNKKNEYVYLEKPKLEPWETVKQGLDKYDDEMAKGLNDELNTLLTFVRWFTFCYSLYIESNYRLVCFPPPLQHSVLVPFKHYPKTRPTPQTPSSWPSPYNWPTRPPQSPTSQWSTTLLPTPTTFRSMSSTSSA